MLSVPELFKKAVCLLPGEAAVRHRSIQFHPRMSEADIPDRMIEFT